MLDKYDAQSRSRTSAAAPSTEAKDRKALLKSKASMPTLRAPSSQDAHASAEMRSASGPGGLKPDQSRLHPPIVASSLGPALSGQVPAHMRVQGKHGMPTAPLSNTPTQRGWLDKVADAILGTDPYGATPEEQQYALICKHCFRHCGLVPKHEFNEVRACI